ncbi:MAG TPA: DUF5320 domain-containing protein [Anaerolineaceae bacterium]|nr:DUF5320 domain-containing protein [Anaerolineaceae bacterium]
MPGKDGTGPTGRGSRTGRGMGNCAPTASNPTPISSTNRPYGQRLGLFDATFGRLFGRGRGRGNRGNQR